MHISIDCFLVSPIFWGGSMKPLLQFDCPDPTPARY